VTTHLKHLLLIRDLRKIDHLELSEGAVSGRASFIRDIPDFPRPGIVFKDITPLLLDARAPGRSVAALAELAEPLDAE